MVNSSQRDIMIQHFNARLWNMLKSNMANQNDYKPGGGPSRSVLINMELCHSSTSYPTDIANNLFLKVMEDCTPMWQMDY